MSTITDAVEKKKREEEARRPKTIDLENPPRVDIPHDWRKVRRALLLVLVLLVVAGLVAGGYIYKDRLRAFVASAMPRFAKGGTVPHVSENGSPTERQLTAETRHEDESAPVVTEHTADAEAEDAAGEDFPEINVDGVFHDPLEPEVLIKGQWMRTGETVDGILIQEISKDGVRVRFKGAERTIRFR
jgi:hypothetical protein